MPPSQVRRPGERATGRPVQALPNTLIVKLPRPKTAQGNVSQFHPARRVSRSPTSFERAFQSNLACPARQPLGSLFFFDFRRGLASLNSLKLNHLRPFVKGLNASLRRLARRPPPFGRQP